MEYRNKSTINWPSIFVMGLVYLVAFAVQWGVSSARMEELERRITFGESQNYIPGNKGVTKDQFDEFRADILSRLIRIEEKQDAQIRREERR